MFATGRHCSWECRNAASSGLIADLREAAPESRQRWDEYRVTQRTFGTKRFRHSMVGDLALDYETHALRGDPDQALYVYTAA